MTEMTHNREIFNESGCLSLFGMEAYLNNRLPGEDRELVKQHLEACPFCSDALEGMSITEEDSPAGIHDGALADEDVEVRVGEPQAGFASSIPSRISGINMRLRRRFSYDPGRRKAAAGMPSIRNIIIPAAASVILLASIITYFHFFQAGQEQLAMGGASDSLTMEKEEAETSRKHAAAAPAERSEAVTIGGVKERPAEAVGQDIKETARVPEDERSEKLRIVVSDGETKDAGQVPAPEKSIAEEMVVAEIEGDGSRSAGKGIREKAVPAAAVAPLYTGPEYPGGTDSLHAFLVVNSRIPLSRDTLGASNVMTLFTITPKGKIRNAEVIRSGGDEHDREALRLIRMMPGWQPARSNGKAVEAEYSLTISFKK